MKVDSENAISRAILCIVAGGELAGIGKHRELIAFERRGSEDVEVQVSKSAHGISLVKRSHRQGRQGRKGTSWFLGNWRSSRPLR